MKMTSTDEISFASLSSSFTICLRFNKSTVNLSISFSDCSAFASNSLVSSSLRTTSPVSILKSCSYNSVASLIYLSIDDLMAKLSAFSSSILILMLLRCIRKEDSLMFNQYEVFLLAVLLRLESDFYDSIIN